MRLFPPSPLVGEGGSRRRMGGGNAGRTETLRTFEVFVPPIIKLMLPLATLAILIALGYQIWGKHQKMPLYFCVVGGLFGYVTSLVVWQLFVLLWIPYQKQLGAFGLAMDVEGWGFGELFVPPVIGLLFLWSTLASLVALCQPMRNRKIAVIGSNIVPGLLLILLAAWQGSLAFLGFSTVMLLTGLCWGLVLYRIAIRHSKLRLA
jgi:hypothetical protein